MSTARTVLFAVCAGVTIAGLVNVYADNADVIARAESAACGSPKCSVQMTRMSRSPLEQSFTFQTSDKSRGIAEVTCKRAYVLVGDYSCARAP